MSATPLAGYAEQFQSGHLGLLELCRTPIGRMWRARDSRTGSDVAVRAYFKDRLSPGLSAKARRAASSAAARVSRTALPRPVLHPSPVPVLSQYFQSASSPPPVRFQSASSPHRRRPYSALRSPQSQSAVRTQQSVLWQSVAADRPQSSAAAVRSPAPRPTGPTPQRDPPLLPCPCPTPVKKTSPPF